MKYLVSNRENLVIGNLDEYVSKDCIVRILYSIIEGFDLENLGFNIKKHHNWSPTIQSKEFIKVTYVWIIKWVSWWKTLIPPTYQLF